MNNPRDIVALQTSLSIRTLVENSRATAVIYPRVARRVAASVRVSIYLFASQPGQSSFGIVSFHRSKASSWTHTVYIGFHPHGSVVLENGRTLVALWFGRHNSTSALYCHDQTLFITQLQSLIIFSLIFLLKETAREESREFHASPATWKEAKIVLFFQSTNRCSHLGDGSTCSAPLMVQITMLYTKSFKCVLSARQGSQLLQLFLHHMLASSLALKM